MLQAGNLQQESSRSKASRKVKVAPNIEIMEKIPQPEAIGKQACWGKSWKIGKIPQPEAVGKQVGWGKSCEIRKIPQIKK